jgi:uncharacterized pyridoxal phosphate-containing UPF0001 family protein
LFPSPVSLHVNKSDVGHERATLFQAVANQEREAPLNVFIQVNTSAEEVKGGVAAADVEALARHIVAECPNLHLQGLMTIGE